MDREPVGEALAAAAGDRLGVGSRGGVVLDARPAPDVLSGDEDDFRILPIRKSSTAFANLRVPGPSRYCVMDPTSRSWW